METEGNAFNPEAIIEGYDLIISKPSKANKSFKSKLDLIKMKYQARKYLNFELLIQSFFQREDTSY